MGVVYRSDRSLAGQSAVARMETLNSLTHPIMYMSVLPSPTFRPSKAVMSSGGVAEPTFQVMMCTLLRKKEREASTGHLVELLPLTQ